MNVNVWMLLGTVVFLSIERICYVVVWRAPEAFRQWCRGHSVPAALARGIAGSDEAIDVLAVLFGAFKVLQVGVFAAWCYVHGDGSLWPESLRGSASSGWALGAGVMLAAAGQILSAAVFSRLGRSGVFYGNKLGREIPWVRGFPFSLFAHPQYVGTVLSVWGLFLVMRFPAPDWIVPPLLETVYYIAGARLEQDRPGPRRAPAAAAQNGRATR